MLSRQDRGEIAAIFGDAVDLEPAARRALLDARCGARADLRAEIDSLLAAHERAASFLERPGGEGRAAEPGPGEGTTVGPWQLHGQIGAGGMGDVYLAERRDGAFEGRAAIKFTRTYLPDSEAARRFRAERQFLASLHHANIVTLLDGGTTSGGHGYLVMEYVDGSPISTFCQNGVLALDARLALMRQVCAGVQFAHQRAIVHRDLKPTNILVTADGVPKILDFGIAKLLEGTAADGSMTSAAGPGPLTPNYASPEQLRGLPVTTACDVYSLGVVLYEVLAGARPYETTGKPLDDVIEAVVETEPPRPSAARPASPLPYPLSRLRGDLDAIVLKAMRKEPEQRYRSAGELGDDLGRVLNREPVVARAPSMGYVMRRVASRHRAAVAIAGAALVAIIAALGLALWQRHVAVEARRQSDRRFREGRQLANALIFKIHDSVAKLPGSTPVRREIVDEALGYLARLERESAGDPALQIELAGGYRQIGAILGDPSFPNLGDRAGGLEQLMKARDLLRPLADSPQATEDAIAGIVMTDNIIGRIRGNTGDAAGSAAMIREAMEYSERAVDRSMPRGKEMLARALFAFSGTVKPREARVPHWERTWRLYEELLAEKPDDSNRQRNVALAGRNLGGLLLSLGRPAEARPHFERALALDERRLAAAPDNLMAQLDTSIELNQLAGLLEKSDPSRALELCKRSLAVRLRLAKADPQDVLSRHSLGNSRLQVARLELTAGDAQAAFDMAREALADFEFVRAKAGGANSTQYVGLALETLGEIEWSLGARASACGRFRRAIDLLAPLPQNVELAFYLPRARTQAAACVTR